MAMKILGNTSITQRTIPVTVGVDGKGNTRELIVHPVKFGKLMEIQRDLPAPLAPSTGVKRKDPRSGQLLKRDGQYVMLRDDGDDKYLEALRIHSMAVNIATVVASLKDQVSDVREKSAELTWQQHWLLVLDDFADVGIDQGIFTTLTQAAIALSEPMTSIEMLLMKTALGTENESDAMTDEKTSKALDALEKAEAQGKA